MQIGKLGTAALAVILLLGLSAGSAVAQGILPAAPPTSNRTDGPKLGVVHTRDATTTAERSMAETNPDEANPSEGSPAGAQASPPDRSSRSFCFYCPRTPPPLTYHGGPTMWTGNTVYAIYWVPSGYSLGSSYQSLISRFFTDVAADSGKSSNVYYSDTQYYDVNSSQPIAYKSTFSTANNVYVDTDPLPASGCTDSYTSVCLTDAQLQTEIINALKANPTWTIGPNSIVFLFTAKGIGSCAGTSCAFSQYCAYHSWFQDTALNNQTVYYANMPYADSVLNGSSGPCDAGQHPNASLDPAADATIQITSHEHNETITDQQGSAWYDSSGNEDGDKCAWNFGTVSGTSGSEYNQTINSNHYFLQREWSNHSSGCVQTGI